MNFGHTDTMLKPHDSGAGKPPRAGLPGCWPAGQPG